jgi:hypothetical protein
MSLGARAARFGCLFELATVPAPTTTNRPMRRSPGRRRAPPPTWKGLVAAFVFTTAVALLVNLIVSGDPEPALSLLAGWAVTMGLWAGVRRRPRRRR